MNIVVYFYCLVCGHRIFVLFFFFQAEDGIRDLVRSRGLGDVYKRQLLHNSSFEFWSGAKVDNFQKKLSTFHTAFGDNNLLKKKRISSYKIRSTSTINLSLIHI